MDLQAIADQFGAVTCIMSVEIKPDGGYGAICIETGNRAYYNSFMDADGFGKDFKFTPGLPYETYIPKDLNFEHFCYQAAVLKKPMHAYVHPDRYNVWFNMFALPLESDDPNKGYCAYSQEISADSKPELMTDTLSRKTTTDVLQTCIKLRGSKDIRATMDEVLADIRALCNANYCCILLTDFKERRCSVFSESIMDGSEQKSVKNFLDDTFFDYAASWLETLAGSDCLVITNPQDMEVVKQRNPNWHRSLKNAKVDSLVLFPLQSNNETIGFIWAVNFNTGDAPRIKETLELTSFFIASEIASYQMFQQLHTLSSMDLLTGVKNRNAMNNRILQFVNGKVPMPKSVGIVFADLNGLKPINDRDGHDAGDCLLKEAAFILKSVFEGCEIYRAGGDEFMIIALDFDRRDLENRVKKLRDDSDDPDNASFAVGFFYDDQGGDIREAMRAADANMYLDKRRFYTRFPELKNR